MIMTQTKPLKEVRESLGEFMKVFVIGCGECATLCQTGGEEQVKTMVSLLIYRWNKEVVGTAIVETPCDNRILRRDLRRNESWKDADAILVLACGVGVQTISEFVNRSCLPALNTRFIGMTEKIGTFYQRCLACGDCLLADTGGICPIARCPKGLLNGPCAGHMNGKCEVDSSKDCAWILICNRLKENGQLWKLRKFREPRDYKITTTPLEIVWR